MKECEINISDAKLKFTTDQNGWCSVVLLFGQNQIELGADSWEIIKNKLGSTLSRSCVSRRPEWVISLSEKHHSLYRQNINNQVEYFWQDASGKEVWRAVVTTPLGKESMAMFREEKAV